MNGLSPTGRPEGGSGGMLGGGGWGAGRGRVRGPASGGGAAGGAGDSMPTSTGLLTGSGTSDTNGAGRDGSPPVGAPATTASPFGAGDWPACGRSERRYASPSRLTSQLVPAT